MGSSPAGGAKRSRAVRTNAERPRELSMNRTGRTNIVVDRQGVFVGVDLGGTDIKAVAVDVSGAILWIDARHRSAQGP